MRYLKSYHKLFESYKDNEYINTDILLDVLNDITTDHDMSINVNTLTSYSDNRNIPKTSIGTGYFMYNKMEFGVYDVKFLLNNIDANQLNVNQTDIYKNSIIKSVKKSLEYYKQQTDDNVIAFIPVDGWVIIDEVSNGTITYIRVYFSRSEILDYVNTKFHRTYNVIK